MGSSPPLANAATLAMLMIALPGCMTRPQA
jgi:hypothetical protein